MKKDKKKFNKPNKNKRFDYTKWRENLFKDLSIDEIIEEGKKFAVDFRKIKGSID